METEPSPERERRLEQEGWARRFSAEEPRLSEMKELYESLGLEVLVVSGVTNDEAGCADCFDVPDFRERYYTLYTRGCNDGRHHGSDELFE